jgi:uncharacterized membrane protein (UPF0127 family)
MIKDPERDESSIEYLGNQNTNEYSSMSIIDPNSNNIVDSDNTGEVSDPEVVNEILFASDNIPINMKKSNVTVISKKIIPGMKSIDEDVRYSKEIRNYDRIVINTSYDNVSDYELLIENFSKKAKNKSEMIVKSSKFDLSVRKISLDLGLDISYGEGFVRVSRSKDFFANYSISENIFECIDAKTDAQKIEGLQAVDFLRDDQGMVFRYDYEQPLTFAMKSVSFPIDIIFCSDGIIKKIYSDVQPGDMRYFGSMADTVIEIRGGRSKELGIKEGDMCFRTDDTPTDLNKLSSYDVYYLSNLIDKDSSILKVADSNTLLRSASVFSERSNLILGKKYFFTKQATYFEPIRNNFVLINDTALSNKNAKSLFSSAFPNSTYSIIKSKAKNPEIIFRIVTSALDSDDCRLFDLSIDKTAAFPVPNSTKESAMSIDKEVVKNIKRIKELVGKLEKNRSIYEKNKDNPKAISGSAGIFRQSVKRLSVNFKAILYSIKVIIKSLNKIKDTTNIEEIINSTLTTTQNLTKFFKQILDLQDKLDSMSFYQDLEQKVSDFVKISEDLETVLGRTRDFIWNHILGKSLLTD